MWQGWPLGEKMSFTSTTARILSKLWTSRILGSRLLHFAQTRQDSHSSSYSAGKVWVQRLQTEAALGALPTRTMEDLSVIAQLASEPLPVLVDSEAAWSVLSAYSGEIYPSQTSSHVNCEPQASITQSYFQIQTVYLAT